MMAVAATAQNDMKETTRPNQGHSAKCISIASSCANRLAKTAWKCFRHNRTNRFNRNDWNNHECWRNLRGPNELPIFDYSLCFYFQLHLQYSRVLISFNIIAHFEFGLGSDESWNSSPSKTCTRLTSLAKSTCPR